MITKFIKELGVLCMAIAVFDVIVFANEPIVFDDNIKAISLSRQTSEEIENRARWREEYPGIDTIDEEKNKVLYFKVKNNLYIDIVRRNYTYFEGEISWDIHFVYQYVSDSFVKVAEFKEIIGVEDRNNKTPKFNGYAIDEITIKRTSISNAPIQLYNNINLEFNDISEAGASAELAVVKNNKKEILPYSFDPNNAQYYIYNTDLDYMYIDRLNGLIFYSGWGDGKGGIVKYNINTNQSELIFKKDSFGDSDRKHYNFFAPMRLPNTQYLIIGAGVSGLRNIYLKEIPEWKKEVEFQNKNEQLHKKAKKSFINGPANIRDNPEGKIIAMLDDMTKVIVLSQKGDWYEILYANVRGWTYKDNLSSI